MWSAVVDLDRYLVIVMEMMVESRLMDLIAQEHFQHYLLSVLLVRTVSLTFLVSKYERISSIVLTVLLSILSITSPPSSISVPLMLEIKYPPLIPALSAGSFSNNVNHEESSCLSHIHCFGNCRSNVSS